MGSDLKAAPTVQCILRNWLSAVCKDQVVESLQEKLQTHLDRRFDPREAELNQVLPNGDHEIKAYDGPTHPGSGLPHGPNGRLATADGRVFRGTFENGSLQGRGRVSLSEGQELTGYFHSGSLVGSVVRTTQSKSHKGCHPSSTYAARRGEGSSKRI